MPSRSSTSREGVRLNKFLASCGLGSRRGCENLIAAGQIQINGETCKNLGARVLPDDAVRHNGIMLQQARETTILLNKPRDFLCSRGDPHGRDTIYNLIPPSFHHLPHIGRLDQDSRGLILLSNAGALSEHLSHPKHKIEKEYHVTLNQNFDHDHIERLTRGIRLEDGVGVMKSVTPLSKRRVSVILTQGYKRQIRNMFDKIGYRVKNLERIRIGNLMAHELLEGKWKILSPLEIEAAMMQNNLPKKVKRKRTKKKI
ncbi:MAG: rRNA pseudouridine synthase [Verrucomicrobiales bacterium]|nr:rRNA pseudouridine synthase [Verrucomicrobiales bacterium]